MSTLKKKFHLFSRNLKEEAEYDRQGRRDGITRIYYRNGQLRKELTYRNGRKEGPALRLLRDGSRIEYECKNGREKTGRWRYYDQSGFLIMEQVYTRSDDLLCELYYDYDEYVRIVTVQWTKFLDDEIEKYKQRASEFDEQGNPGFPFEKRSSYPSVGTHPHF
jgi:antitoxin component YwqK of YwqJK toxin-antitoxin module